MRGGKGGSDGSGVGGVFYAVLDVRVGGCGGKDCVVVSLPGVDAWWGSSVGGRNYAAPPGRSRQL